MFVFVVALLLLLLLSVAVNLVLTSTFHVCVCVSCSLVFGAGGPIVEKLILCMWVPIALDWFRTCVVNENSYMIARFN